MRRQKCAEDGTDGRGDLEEHADADARKALADVGCGGTGGRCNGRDQRRADSVAQVDVKDNRQKRDEDDPAAEACERSQQTGCERAGEDEDGKQKQGHSVGKYGMRAIAPHDKLSRGLGLRASNLV